MAGARLAAGRAGLNGRRPDLSFTHADGPPPLGAARLGGFEFSILLGLGLSVALSIALVRWQVSTVPVRAMPLALTLLIMALARPRVMRDVLREHPMKISIIAATALLGAVVSLLNGEAAPLLARQLLEIHAQALITLVAAAGAIKICGARPVAFCLIAAVAVSVIFAIAQFAGMDSAWQARAWLGAIQQDNRLTQLTYIRQERALGLSMSPVHLGTQMILALAAYWAAFLQPATKRSRAFTLQVSLVVGVAILACVVTGNRSPLAGILVFAALFFATRGASGLLAMLAAAIIAAPLVAPVMAMLETSGLRVASVDGSALGRLVLQNYGLQLFRDHPIGYGLGFESNAYWSAYWEGLQWAENTNAIRNYALHNYFLNMLCKYGVGILVIGAIICARIAPRWGTLLPFSAYIVHIFFHNDGPLQSDFLFWLVVPLYAAPAREGVS